MELLEYLAPADGRPYPADARPNDLLHWETTIAVDRLEAVLARLDAAGVPRLSRAPAMLGARNLGLGDGVLVQDPDGHVVRLIDR